MTAPKIDTIRRYCDSSLAVEILRERGIITQMEADGLFARVLAKREAAYERIYGPRVHS